MFSTTLSSKNSKKVKILLDFEKMRLKNGNFEKKSLFALKNTRLTTAHFQKLFFELFDSSSFQPTKN